MADKNSKIKFKAKVIAKLFGLAGDEDTGLVVTSDDSTAEDVAYTSSVPGDGDDVQAYDVPPLYGIHLSQMSGKQNWLSSDRIVRPMSAAAESDGSDETENSVVSRKRRRRRKGHQRSDKSDHVAISSASGISQDTENPHPSDSSLTKNKKRKLKKKRKEKDRGGQRPPPVEFIFTSSGDICNLNQSSTDKPP